MSWSWPACPSTCSPAPTVHRIGAFAFWSDEDALDRFLEDHEAGPLLADGWQMRMQPTRLVGSWPGLGSLADHELPMDMDEPTAGLTLGQLRPSQLIRFLKASARAERDALGDGAMLASTGLARPPGAGGDLLDLAEPRVVAGLHRRCGCGRTPARGQGARRQALPSRIGASCGCVRCRSPAMLRGGPGSTARSLSARGRRTCPHRPEIGSSGGGTRTHNQSVNSRLLCH